MVETKQISRLVNAFPFATGPKVWRYLFKTGKLFILLLWTGLIISGCGRHHTNHDISETGIKVAVLNGPSALSIIKMMDDGRLDYHNLPVDFIIRNEPSQIKSLMFRNEVDFAFLPSTMAAVLYNNGIDYQLVSVPLWGSMYLVGTLDSIRTLSGLKGSTVCQMGRGVVPDIVFRYILSANHLVPDEDVMISYNFPSHVELANAVRAGVAPLGILSEPQVSLILKQNGKARVILDLAKEWDKVTGDSIPFAQTMVVVKRSLAEDHPDVVTNFIKEFNNNIDWIKSHPNEAGGLMVHHKLLPDSAAAVASIPRCNLGYSNGPELKKQVLSFYRILFDLNKDVLGGKVPDENFFCKE